MTCSGVPLNLARRSSRWVAMPVGTGVDVALAGHRAAHRDQRRGAEAVALRAEQRRDHHVASGLEPAVGPHLDPVPQPVAHQGRLRLRQPQLPGRAGVLDGGERRGAGAAVVPGDEHVVGVRLRHARRDGADAGLGDQLDAHARARVHRLEIVDQLRQVLDRVDVVVRRRRDQRRRRAPRAGAARSGR